MVVFVCLENFQTSYRLIAFKIVRPYCRYGKFFYVAISPSNLHLLFFFEYCQLLGAGAFLQGFYHKCGPQSRALKIETLKAPLFRGPEGAWDTNDWCINVVEQHHDS